MSAKAIYLEVASSCINRWMLYVVVIMCVMIVSSVWIKKYELYCNSDNQLLKTYIFWNFVSSGYFSRNHFFPRYFKIFPGEFIILIQFIVSRTWRAWLEWKKFFGASNLCTLNLNLWAHDWTINFKFFKILHIVFSFHTKSWKKFSDILKQTDTNKNVKN